MDFTKYQQLASRTSSTETEHNIYIKINFALGLVGETGETVDYLKKVLFHGHKFDKEKLSSELGDVLWYVSQLALIYGLDLQFVAEDNIKKLKKRYPEGFTTERSVNREEGQA